MRVRKLMPMVAAALVIAVAAPVGMSEAVAAGARTVRAALSTGSTDEDYETITITMQDNLFLPQTVTVDPGTELKFVNTGRNKHNVLPSEPADWKSPTIKPKGVFEHRFMEPGVFGYYCSFHGAPGFGMYGTVIVKNADGTIPAAALNRTGAKERGKPKTIRVPKDAKRIQTAVDKAAPGDLILVSPGVYKEAVTVTTDRLVIRGLDRNKVILDGGYKLDNGIKVLGADGVAVENMTARRFTSNGFFWTGVQGYRGSYLTATRNGDYAIYAFDSTDGLFEHDYGSGSPDAGFYIGQCYPCNAEIRDSIAEWNGLGYSGTNAGGNLIITKSVWRNNRAGIVPNSGDGEQLAPQHDTTVVGNVVYGNNNGKTPAIDAAKLAQGNGILVAGGNTNLITHNLVFKHDIAGIAIVPNPDKTVWIASGNKVLNNVVRGSDEADLAAFAGDANCFAENKFGSSKPSNIEQVLPCTGTGVPPTDALDLQKYLDASKPDSVDYRKAKIAAVPRLAGMKNAAKAPARPAVRIVVRVDVDSITTPRDTGVTRG